MMLIDEVLTAKDRIKAVEDGVRETPLEEAGAFSERTSTTLLLKYEHLLRAGSFKMRGAMNKVPSLGEDERRRGIVNPCFFERTEAVPLFRPVWRLAKVDRVSGHAANFSSSRPVS